MLLCMHPWVIRCQSSLVCEKLEFFSWHVQRNYWNLLEFGIVCKSQKQADVCCSLPGRGREGCAMDMNPPCCLQKDRIPAAGEAFKGGIEMQPGQDIMINTWSMHRNKVCAGLGQQLVSR